MQGTVIKFRYEAGSEPGAVRRLYVTSDNSENHHHGLISGYDLDRGEWRQFRRSKMINAAPTDDEVRIVSVDLFPDGFCTEDLEYAYEMDGYEIHWTDNDDTLIALKRNMGNIVSATWRDVTFCTEKGSIILGKDNNMGPVANLALADGKGVDTTLKSPREFYDLLGQIL